MGGVQSYVAVGCMISMGCMDGQLHSLGPFGSLTFKPPKHAGTTTATVLTRAILSEGCKSVAAGMNPMDLRRGINLAVDHVVSVSGLRSC